MRFKLLLFAAVAVALAGLVGLGSVQGPGVTWAGMALLGALLLIPQGRRARAEAAEREVRRSNALLEETVRARTAELREANAKLTTSLQQLQATRSQLLFADRLVTVGQLAAGVSHEINNPLSFILANLNYVRAELGQLQAAPSREQRRMWLEALDEAHDGAERVRLIVKDLQNLTRAESMESGPVDVGAVVRSAAKMAGHEIRHRARLVLDVDGAPEVHGNGARLCQVFLNLLLNAAHAIEPGDVDAHTIQVTVRPHGPERLRVEVRDTGCGIPAEHLERIFDPFFTTKPHGVGTGLGLAVCHSIITAHGGDILVESTAGRGTTFQVELPLSPAEAASGPLAASAA